MAKFQANERNCRLCTIVRAFGDDLKGDFDDPAKCGRALYEYLPGLVAWNSRNLGDGVCCECTISKKWTSYNWGAYACKQCKKRREPEDTNAVSTSSKTNDNEELGDREGKHTA
jgi:hypothetical protein